MSSLHQDPLAHQGGALLPPSGTPRLVHDITSPQPHARISMGDGGLTGGPTQVEQQDPQRGTPLGEISAAGTPMGVVVLAADVVDLLYAEGGGGGGRTRTAACLACVLGLMHCWGVDDGADRALLVGVVFCCCVCCVWRCVWRCVWCY